MRNKGLKKQKRTYILPLILLFAVGYFAYSVSFYFGYSEVQNQISVICRYLGAFYTVILFTESIYHSICDPKPHKLTQAKSESSDKKHDLKKSFFKRNFEKTKPHAEEDDSSQSINDGTQETESVPIVNERKTALKLRILKIVYVVIQVFLVFRFIQYQVQDAAMKIRSFENDKSLFQLGLTIAGAVIFLSFSVWMKGKDRKPGSNTARFFILGVGAVFSVCSLFYALYIMLEIPCLNVLLWLCRIFSAMMSLIVIVGIVVSAIKGELLGDFDYFSFVDYLKTDEKKDLASFLEKYTGLSVKSLWSIRYALNILPVAIIGLVAVLFVSTCFYKVDSYEQGVMYRFGKLGNDSIVETGLHAKLPWPIDKVEIFDVKRVKELSIGYEDSVSNDNLWTQTHSGEEYKLLLGNGNELVSINMKLVYVISDLKTYVTAYSSPEDLLNAKAYEIVLQKTVNTDLDTFLSVDRSGLAQSVLQELNAFCDEVNFGLTVKQVYLESIHPPIDIADVYQGVVSAAVQKTTLITNAEAEALEKVAGAEEESNTLVIAAKADQTSRLADAQSEMETFLAAAKAYKDHPDAVTLSKYLDTFTAVVSGKKVYVFIGDIDPSDYIMNFSTNSTVIDPSTILPNED